ncbi:zinc finger protein 135-like [Plectropomus leopardus]|uniref:zinc finger protein 135-like n=1 Tax=Plectropomus leopardus TaxID=160734 RepID=UPI001C4D6C7B|nr:zinc finger protein 135-like [Plectropomus leopardus]
MCKVQSVGVLVKQQLTAAAEEIFGLFETTISEYEDEISRLCRLLEDDADIQRVLVGKEEVPSEQQQHPEPRHIKEEQEEVWSSQEGEQLQGLKVEDDTTEFAVTAVPVKGGPKFQLPTLKLKQTQAAAGLLVKQRLTAAVEQIVELFERTLTEYERKLSQSNEEIGQQRKLLDAVLKPEVRLYRADVQQVLVCKEEVPSDQQHPEPRHIKEEQEEVWSSQEGEQLQGLEEDDIIKFPFAAVKSEDDEEKAQTSQLHQIQTDEQMVTAADGDDCGGSEPARNSDPASDDNNSVSSGAETEDSDDVWRESSEPQSHLDALKKANSQSVKNFICVVCGKILCSKRSIYSHMTVHVEHESFICPICGKTFTHQRTLLSHMKIHVDGKPFSCSVCKKGFNQRRSLIEHIRTHTGEKPYSCSVCNKSFHRRGVWIVHTRSHAEEKPFSCSLCGKKFGHQAHLRRHEKRHSAEKPFSCTICGRCFNDKGHLKRHTRLHTGEKTFGCDVCGRKFFQQNHLKTHKCVVFPTDP